jgi:hypothetical protein
LLLAGIFAAHCQSSITRQQSAAPQRRDRAELGQRPIGHRGVGDGSAERDGALA